MEIEFNQDWREFLCALIARRVRFLLIGGHAVAGHGEPRLTEDLDVFVEPTLANARRLRDALVDFGFGRVAPPVAELAARDKISRVEAVFVARPLYVIGRAALIRNKRAAGRTKDLFDLALLGANAPRARPSGPPPRARRRRPPR